MSGDGEEVAAVYFEDLPDQCPPAEAVDAQLAAVWRVVPGAQPTVEDFHSHAKRGKRKPPTVADCAWASCSLFNSRTKAASIAAKLPKPRFEHAYLSELQIAQGSGRSLIEKEHVHFWMYAGFDPMQAIIQTTPI
jgi:hypothetical protein